MTEWLKLEDISKELGVHYSTVLRWVTSKNDAKRLRAYRVGAQWRVKREDLTRWIEAGGEGPGMDAFPKKPEALAITEPAA